MTIQKDRAREYLHFRMCASENVYDEFTRALYHHYECAT